VNSAGDWSAGTYGLNVPGVDGGVVTMDPDISIRFTVALDLESDFSL
jgi:hypothetical protein